MKTHRNRFTIFLFLTPSITLPAIPTYPVGLMKPVVLEME